MKKYLSRSSTVLNAAFAMIAAAVNCGIKGFVNRQLASMYLTAFGCEGAAYLLYLVVMHVLKRRGERFRTLADSVSTVTMLYLFGTMLIVNIMLEKPDTSMMR